MVRIMATHPQYAQVLGSTTEGIETSSGKYTRIDGASTARIHVRSTPTRTNGDRDEEDTAAHTQPPPVPFDEPDWEPVKTSVRSSAKHMTHGMVDM